MAWWQPGARTVAWRVPPGERADPYAIWVAEVMAQQTTVAAAGPRVARFLARWPTLDALAAAQEGEVLAEWAGLGYYARARNLVRAARAASAMGGLPGTESGLRALPGVGDYTAAAIAAIAYGVRTLPVDANIARVAARLMAGSPSRAEARAALSPLVPAADPGGFAQALMDLGATICTARVPHCAACPVRGWCAGAAAGTPARWPEVARRAERPLRRGIAWWIECDGSVLLVRRPANGLLGGMEALPSSAWTAGDLPDPDRDAPVRAPWHLLAPPISHAFTHFRLELSIAVACVDAQPDVPGRWVPVAVAHRGLPTLFAKAVAAVRRHRAGVAAAGTARDVTASGCTA